jgi:hypothetical protein
VLWRRCHDDLNSGNLFGASSTGLGRFSGGASPCESPAYQLSFLDRLTMVRSKICQLTSLVDDVVSRCFYLGWLPRTCCMKSAPMADVEVLLASCLLDPLYRHGPKPRVLRRYHQKGGSKWIWRLWKRSIVNGATALHGMVFGHVVFMLGPCICVAVSMCVQNRRGQAGADLRLVLPVL